MKIRIPIPKLHPTGGPPSGCVPHVPAPGCWPERKSEDINPCFPSKGLFERLADYTRDNADRPRQKKR